MFRTAQKAFLSGSILALMLSTAGLAPAEDDTSTPIKHVVVIFQENISFDHYFGTYPNAQPNTDGSRYFKGAREATPRVNNLVSAGLLTNNPNGANWEESETDLPTPLRERSTACSISAAPTASCISIR